MRFPFMLKEPTWWLWTLTAASLAAGMAGYEVGFFCAITLSLAQTVIYAVSEPSCWSHPVQVRLVYTILLCLFQIPPLRWMNWVPVCWRGCFRFVLGTAPTR